MDLNVNFLDFKFSGFVFLLFLFKINSDLNSCYFLLLILFFILLN